MPEHFFVCYSAVDGEKLALRLADELAAGPPAIPIWIDKRRLRPGEDWDEQIVEAIRISRGMLLVLTKDSVHPQSVCKDEWVRALKYKKAIIPLLAQRDVDLPFRLGSREYIDFTGSFDAAIARLRKHLDWMNSPQAQLQHMKYRLADAQRELPRAQPEQQARIQDDIAELERQIAQQEAVVEDPSAAAQRVQQRVEHSLELMREPAKPAGGVRQAKFVNPPPSVAPTWFQNRHFESGQIGDFLKDDALRLMTVVGRGGIGKSAMVCRLLKSLEGGRLPDDAGPLSVDGIVYLSNARSFHRVTVPELYAGLSQLLSDDVTARIDAVYKNPQASTREIMEALLAAFANCRIVVLLDNFEDAIDTSSGGIKSPELYDALRALLELPLYGLKVIVTTRVAPVDLTALEPGRQRILELDKGLEHPFAENALRAMDWDGKLGLRDAPDTLLATAGDRTRGNPRALEHLYGILSADRDTTLKEILEDTRRLLPEQVVEVLVGEAFNRLEAASQRVMLALATYRYPVPAAAVDYLLQPYLPGVDSAPILKRLVNMQFARRELGRYYVHQVDRDYALNRIPEGNTEDRRLAAPPLTQLAVTHRAAEWFKQTRKPREDWKSLDDLAPQLSEFELRLAGEEYDEAASALLEIGSDYLMIWGHFGLLTELHDRLQGRISDPQLATASAADLGVAHYRMGQYQQAIACHERSLSLAREQQDRAAEAAEFGNLGIVYAALGDAARAIGYYEQARTLNREAKDRFGEAVNLGSLANQYLALGRHEQAFEYYRMALDIHRELQDAQNEALVMANMGDAYADLGDPTHALEFLTEAYRLARQIRYRLIEMGALTFLGHVYIDKGQADQAVERFKQSIDLADAAGVLQFQMDARIGLAQAHLFQNQLVPAREVAQAARRLDFPLSNAHASCTEGIIAIRQDDRPGACEALSTAVTQADTLLARNPSRYDALDLKGLALCGLALCENVRHLAGAEDAFRSARAISAAQGALNRITRYFDALAVVDRTGLLQAVRATAVSSAPQSVRPSR